jgi:hypothetical protein
LGPARCGLPACLSNVCLLRGGRASASEPAGLDGVAVPMRPATGKRLPSAKCGTGRQPRCGSTREADDQISVLLKIRADAHVDLAAGQRAQYDLGFLPGDVFVQLAWVKRLIAVQEEDAKDVGDQWTIPANEAWLAGTLAAQALQEGICLHHFCRIWVYPIYRFCVAMVGEPSLAVATELTSHSNADILPASRPPVVVDMELGIKGRSFPLRH